VQYLVQWNPEMQEKILKRPKTHPEKIRDERKGFARVITTKPTTNQAKHKNNLKVLIMIFTKIQSRSYFLPAVPNFMLDHVKQIQGVSKQLL
jgi:hypothetical protein